MWIIAGALLGLVVLTALVGFHSSPHLHVAAGAIGVVAAAWLLVMALDGRSSPGLWTLWGADVAVSAGLGVLAWNGLAKRHARSLRRPLEGTEGVATTDLTPDGIARVGGEEWSVHSVNGTVREGGRVQVIRAGGVRLEVWGEDVEPPLISETSQETGAPDQDAPVDDRADTWDHPSDLHPSDLHPSDLHPSDLHPSDLHPSDLHPSDNKEKKP